VKINGVLIRAENMRRHFNYIYNVCRLSFNGSYSNLCSYSNLYSLIQRQLETLGAQRAGLEDMLREMKRKVSLGSWSQRHALISMQVKLVASIVCFSILRFLF
jgi:hypothetical protein